MIGKSVPWGVNIDGDTDTVCTKPNNKSIVNIHKRNCKTTFIFYNTCWQLLLYVLQYHKQKMTPVPHFDGNISSKRTRNNNSNMWLTKKIWNILYKGK